MNTAATPRLERIASVCARTGLSRSSLYRLIRAGDFPAPVPLAGRTRAWDSTAIDNWISACIAAGANTRKAA